MQDKNIKNPIELKKGETLDVSKASPNNPIWVKARLAKGKNEFKNAGNGNFIPLKECRPSGDGISYDGYPVQWTGDSFIEEATEEKDFIFMVSNAEGRAKVMFVDNNTDGISRIELDSDSKPAIYTINGTNLTISLSSDFALFTVLPTNMAAGFSILKDINSSFLSL